MRDIRRYFIHVIQLLRGPIGDEGVGKDGYGEPLTQATPETLTLDARVEWDNRRVMDDSGQEIVCAGMVFLRHSYPDPATGADIELTIGGQDRIVFEDREHPIVTRNRCEGWGWTIDPGSHWEVWIR